MDFPLSATPTAPVQNDRWQLVPTTIMALLVNPSMAETREHSHHSLLLLPAALRYQLTFKFGRVLCGVPHWRLSCGLPPPTV
jgi:hypothetical protein